ncbi:MAG: flagellar basal body rod protein FlgC [Candidatus Cloacimonadota bacterium]|nr:MAG: flagellar basal body rod protein FlgC [Candidatus Cloacimonadota bacterium]
MTVFRAFDIAASGLTAERLRMDIISNNIANVNTTKTNDGNPYRRQLPVFEAVFNKEMDNIEKANKGESFNGSGVRVSQILEDSTKFKTIYDPSHPHANDKGYVDMPNVNIVKEMVDMITASRAYEANVTALSTSKQIFNSALSIGQG